MIGIGHLDSNQCQRTGNPEIPVLYTDRNTKIHKLKWYEVIPFSEFPSPIEKMNGATVDRPAIVIFKANHKELGVLPSKAVWNKRPISGQIGSISFISRRDIWEQNIKAFGADAGGDYTYLQSVWQDKPSVVWLDEVLAGVQRISRGQPEL